MKKIYKTLLLALCILPFQLTLAQIGYSPVVDSLVNLITIETLTTWEEQLTGEVEVTISGQPETIVSRHSNNPSNALAAQFILEQFQGFGLNAEFQNFGSQGENVIATKTGTKYPDKEYIICCHYDDMPSGPVAPGADDNGSGTVGVLEAARLLADMDLDYTVKFIAFDEEEQGLIGSYHYANLASSNGDDILGVLNMDMIAWDSDDDYHMSISVNDPSMPFANLFISGMGIYAPLLSHNFISTTASDHSPFWANGYQAILVIEDWNDFHAFYHTVNDNLQNLNMPFFLEMAKASVGTIASLAMDLTLQLYHEPLTSGNFTGDRVADLIISSNLGIPGGSNAPRLYYQIEGEDFVNLNASEIIDDTFRFIIPGQPVGTDVAYYFAVQDSSGNLMSTLPYGGQGLNPPGTTPPAELYDYFVGDQIAH
ncbi:MAG: M20/M25/M40 family metallo-hydrolase, partial [Bacteroidota bacterium]|nr:M20/M25/M40 family metallo-hydrolase [Bacteroidota bacterium]